MDAIQIILLRGNTESGPTVLQVAHCMDVGPAGRRGGLVKWPGWWEHHPFFDGGLEGASSTPGTRNKAKVRVLSAAANDVIWKGAQGDGIVPGRRWSRSLVVTKLPWNMP